MNINNIVRSNLAGLFANQNLVFTNTSEVWLASSRTPTKTTSSITLIGRIQPMDSKTIAQLGFNIMDYQYFRVYVSDISPTQADKVRQLGSSTFTYNGRTYQIVGKLPYDVEGWRELYAYLIG